MAKGDDFQKKGNLEELLMKKDNIDYLEFIISNEVSLFQDVLGKKSMWKKGPKVKGYDHLKSVYGDVRLAVDDYLGASATADPKISLGKLGAFKANWYWHVPFLYFWGSGAVKTIAALPAIIGSGGILAGAIALSIPTLWGLFYYQLATQSQNFYTPRGRKVNIKKDFEEEAKIVLAHEYTHFLQHASGIRSRILMEGHARGVERKIAEMYSRKDNNPICYIGTLSRSLGELKTEYDYLCKRLGARRAGWMKKLKVRGSRGLLGGPSHYAKGVSLFWIAEQKFPGHNVYAEVLRQDFSHLKI